ncbi:uncharacterized protein LACBIDRAFT_330424 [Laccaria bicolor S238N-H82]|uniref:Predicted protein n=1 Tax=Laccaria bicolor (strain S238N-H82 / ATCC MYA-4686) TaxID=486041 RepID=B0DL94_LACBS|nr:uncharacterized protein LACBIDRAFT_330424 [Laccaria bicolor S238N-H82]EDR04611.1 predicted protein [Laccaria bicolor S238N-H82]|eukprot:XP_001884783.1 predicted protein [Laccaria bicolor S238N-H82]
MPRRFFLPPSPSPSTPPFQATTTARDIDVDHDHDDDLTDDDDHADGARRHATSSTTTPPLQEPHDVATPRHTDGRRRRRRGTSMDVPPRLQPRCHVTTRHRTPTTRQPNEPQPHANENGRPADEDDDTTPLPAHDNDCPRAPTTRQ